jgi:uncharacterized protein with HEPN domain
VARPDPLAPQPTLAAYESGATSPRCVRSGRIVRASGATVESSASDDDLLRDAERMDRILDAIARAKVADRRLRLAQSLVDDIGVQLAYQAILHNLDVIAEAVRSIPAEILERDPGTPWREIVALPDAIGHSYLRIDPEVIRRMVETQLAPLDVAVRRLRAAQ